MANKLFQQMNSNNIIQQVQMLKQRMGGDPMQHIQQLMNSGKITQEQYNAAVKKAEQLKSILGH